MYNELIKEKKKLPTSVHKCLERGFIFKNKDLNFHLKLQKSQKSNN